MERKISLNGKHGQGKFAIVDDVDYTELMKYEWRVNNYGYAVRNEKGSPVLMHRQILKTPKDLVTDHVNGDRLDNRRSNLRVATRAENNRNVSSYRGTSEYKGVGWVNTKNLWIARLKNKHLGYFEDQKEAAKVYDYFAHIEYGEFAYLNFPEELMDNFEKSNLRRKNTSGYIGVSWAKERNKWHAYIKGLDGKRINLGRYTDKNVAAKTYNQKAIELYGDSALLNEICEEVGVDGGI